MLIPSVHKSCLAGLTGKEDSCRECEKKLELFPEIVGESFKTLICYEVNSGKLVHYQTESGGKSERRKGQRIQVCQSKI